MLVTCAFGSARRRLAGCSSGIGRAGYPAEHLLSDRLGAGRPPSSHSAETSGDPFGTGHRVSRLSAAPALLGRGKFELARLSRKLAPDLSAFGRASPGHHFL